MSFKHVIALSKNIRTIDFNTIINTYNFYLRKLVFKLLYGSNNKNKKLSANDAYNELEIIEIYINNPDNIIAMNCLTEINKNISENSKNEKSLNNDNQSQNEKQIIEFEIEDRRKTKIRIEANKNMTLENLSNIFYSKLVEEYKLIDINEFKLNKNIPLNIKSKKTLSELKIENNSIITVKPPKNDMIIEFIISPEKIFKIEANEYMTLDNLMETFKLKFIKESKLIDENGYRLNENIPLTPNSVKTLSELRILNGSKIKVILAEKNNLLIKFILVKKDGKEKEIEIIANEEMIFETLISLLMLEIDEDLGKIEQCLLNDNIPINPKSKKTLSCLKLPNKSKIKIIFK